MPNILGTPYVALTYRAPGNFVANVATLADFNKDGRLDILVAFSTFDANWNPAEIDAPLRLFLGDGAGHFSIGTNEVIRPTVPGTTAPTKFAVGDFNGDGDPDVYLVDHGMDAPPFPGHANVLLVSDGRGHLKPKSIAGAPSDFSLSTTAADIDGDRDLDLFVLNLGGSGTQIAPYFLINNGSGGFSRDDSILPPPYDGSTDYQFASATLADLDGDGDPDLVLGVSTLIPEQSVVLKNNGSGAFGVSITLPAKPSFGDSPDDRTAEALDNDVADLNGDGRMDIVMTYTSGFAFGRYMQILIQTGTGKFVDKTPTLLPQSLSPSRSVQSSTTLIDMDGDGDLDIVAEVGEGAIVYANDGRGKFAESGKITKASNGLAVGDVNGDTLPDVVWGYPSGPNDDVWVALNMFRAGKDRLKGGKSDDVLKSFGGDDTLMGLAGDDELWGGFGNDRITGGNGADLLVGDRGKDNFVFDTKLGAANIDHIADFTPSSDRILLDRSVFAMLDAGPLNKSAFFKGKKIDDAGPGAIIAYGKKSGELALVAGKKEVVFAILDGSPDGVSHSDFVVVA